MDRGRGRRSDNGGGDGLAVQPLDNVKARTGRCFEKALSVEGAKKVSENAKNRC